MTAYSRSLTWARRRISVVVLLCLLLRTARAVEWSSWSSWSECDKPCNSGQRTRTRSCPSPGGCTDASSAVETQACNTDQCEGAWSSWTAWSECKSICGQSAQRSRLRSCVPTQPDANSSLVWCGSISDHYNVDSCTLPVTPTLPSPSNSVTAVIEIIKMDTVATEGETLVIKCCVPSSTAFSLELSASRLTSTSMRVTKTVTNTSRIFVTSRANMVTAIITPALASMDSRQYSCHSSNPFDIVHSSTTTVTVNPKPSPSPSTTLPVTATDSVATSQLQQTSQPSNQPPPPTSNPTRSSSSDEMSGDDGGSSAPVAIIAGAAAGGAVILLIIVIVVIVRRKSEVKILRVPIPANQRNQTAAAPRPAVP